ncbi:MAG: L,D-transpeptidase [Alphaproteobacteria bacterium]|nr:L,D-transpeptidase [Alphaproteobacteria bacterium]
MWGDNIRRRPSTTSKPYKLKSPGILLPPSALGAGPAVANSLGTATRRRKPRKPIELAEGGARPEIAPKQPKTVEFNGEFEPGDIVIDTSRRRLYLVLAPTGALAYPIAVGKRGFAWTGVEQVTHVTDWPDWYPPEEMRERNPRLPLKMTGGLKNPLGAKAIYLGKTLYRIHGTNAKWSIGRASSSGCFRMHNAHVVHLARLIDKNTTVHVLDRLPKGVVKEVKKKRRWSKRRKKSRRKRYRRSRRPNTI